MASSATRDGVLRFAFAGIARRTALSVRIAVLLSLVLIAGCFAAAAALRMRMDRIHALTQAAYYEERRAQDIAAVANVSLDRIADAGRAFADSGSSGRQQGLRNIALFDRAGTWVRVRDGNALNFPDLDEKFIARAALRPVLTSTVLAFRYRDNVVAVSFDPAALVPRRLLQDAALVGDDGTVLAAGTASQGTGGPAVRLGSWPLVARTFIDPGPALDAWRGSLPIYLFIILGPAVAAACLAPLIAREFERYSRAAAAVRNLRSASPEERRLLVRLAEAERRSAEGIRAKSEFISHMSHELRTPLNAVIGFAEIIETGLYGPAGHPKYVEYARDIANAGRNLHSRIGDILEYANVEAGRFPLESQTIDLLALASICVAEHQGRAFSRRITLELGASEPVEASADPSAVQRIVSILLSNALSYAREGSRVRLEVRAEAGAAVLIARDRGVGFNDAERRHAQEPFTRFDRRGRSSGTGLGLAIATALAHRMGGALVIGGYHGLGASVELRLPRR